MALELSTAKLRAEEASLRDSLSKLSALNEGLAQDKLALNHLVAQVRGGPVDPPAFPPPASPAPAHPSLDTSVPLSRTSSVLFLVV